VPSETASNALPNGMWHQRAVPSIAAADTRDFPSAASRRFHDRNFESDCEQQKALENDAFSRACCLVAGARFELATFRLKPFSPPYERASFFRPHRGNSLSWLALFSVRSDRAIRTAGRKQLDLLGALPGSSGVTFPQSIRRRAATSADSSSGYRTTASRQKRPIRNGIR